MKQGGTPRHLHNVYRCQRAMRIQQNILQAQVGPTINRGHRAGFATARASVRQRNYSAAGDAGLAIARSLLTGQEVHRRGAGIKRATKVLHGW